MKVGITGAQNFVKRLFEGCGSYQWAREFLKNSIEANATKVEFGLEWQAVKQLGHYRRTVIDNGDGMDAEQLTRFFSTIGEGGKKIGGSHDNFGVGAKIASLPWNPKGLVVISYKEGKGSMIWIVFDEASGDYELVDLEHPKTGKTCVYDPADVNDDDGIKWAELRPSWVKEHGTIIVMLGSDAHPDTVLGDPDASEQDTKGLSGYLNTRFWDIGDHEVTVTELRSDKKNQWPRGPKEKDNTRRTSHRRIYGAKYYLTSVPATHATLEAQGELKLDKQRLSLEWYLWKGERPDITSYAKRPGYIALRYKGELFQLTTSKAQFRNFGIVPSKVHQNLTIILEPQLYTADDGHWGVHPDQSRNRLMFSGAGVKSGEMPLSDWGNEFCQAMPDAILEAIREAQANQSGSLNNEEYRKRLQDLFGTRWTQRVLVKATKPKEGAPAVEPTESDVGLVSQGGGGASTSKQKRRKTLKAYEPGPEAGEEREVPVGIPRYEYVAKSEFEKPWHIASWVPRHTKGPTVLINEDAPVVQEAVKYHEQQYGDLYAEQVATAVKEVIGEDAVSKIAHSQKLNRDIPEQDLNTEYRSERALTIALMGLMTQEAVIAQRLTRQFGPKKAPATP